MAGRQQQQQQKQQQGGQGPSPALQSKLEHTSTERLEQLLTDEAAVKQFIIEYVSTTPGARTLRDIQARNLALAQENLDMQDQIEEVRNHVAVVRSSEFSTTQASFRELYSRQAAVLDTISGPVLVERLAQDEAKLDEASAALQDDLLAGRIGVEAFVEAYVAKRTAFHALDLRRQVVEFSSI
mmetsp:Transcript_20647/g.35335  ORF Transcript_20647/g.35335 Transcript_20647/m.35335 type:complete len:183 (+) Transcript_20647:134-682(+)|eukprot:CAMPEP_0119109652 /NCGR_PEP_ID=MMETSP1180-20130426/21690_1 /TAXON_ID=3052 ORGANISM="Chlamydomonas cf sp, Strain CCMP681" /NCGR_SAMPLE_ID=MMETSP1180 /ASSEMBLY_ACC=CAM_ASM_000741 /LENGTH=182 /DNA_ID=CAMNT_0007095525 /DNA_START=32 /DNA_END=580 /DNA_ORIENTATION=+